MKPQPTPATLWDFVRYFLKLGTLGFGGPIALAGYMQRDLVDERGWIAPDAYKQGLALRARSRPNSPCTSAGYVAAYWARHS